MKLARPMTNIQKKEVIHDSFGGFNNSINAKEFEFVDMKNLTSDEFPQISQRKSRELVRTLATPNGLFSDGLKMCWVDGTKFYYDGIEKGLVANSKKQFVEINKNILIFPDKMFYDTVAGTFGTFASGTPEIDYAVVHNNRVFGVKGQNVYASKQGDFKQWNTFAGLVTDSYATDVAGAGSFKGITKYQNHVVIQTETTMFELYGYKPENFQIQEAIKQGVLSNTYAELNSTLYFANENGVYIYNGGLPHNISEDRVLLKFNSNAVSGTDGQKYYISLDSGLFIYDPKFDIWHKEDDVKVVSFTYHNGFIYALLTDGKMIKFNSGSELVRYSAIFAETFDGDYFSKKGVRTIEIYAEMGPESFVSVCLKDSTKNDFVTVATFASETERSLMIPMLVNAQAYQLKLEGYGSIKIRAIKKVLLRGGKR